MFRLWTLSLCHFLSLGSPEPLLPPAWKIVPAQLNALCALEAHCVGFVNWLNGSDPTLPPAGRATLMLRGRSWFRFRAMISSWAKGRRRSLPAGHLMHLSSGDLGLRSPVASKPLLLITSSSVSSVTATSQGAGRPGPRVGTDSTIGQLIDLCPHSYQWVKDLLFFI